MHGKGGMSGREGACMTVGACVAGDRVCMAGGVPCDLSRNAFDVMYMLSLHQLRLITSTAAYIVLLGHVTCDVC